MIRRRKALSAAALCIMAAGGAAAWTLTPSRVRADTPKVEQHVLADPWAKGPVDRGNMVQGVLDYRSDRVRR